MLLARSRHFKKQLDTETRQLQEIFSKHLQDPSISEEAMEALEGKLAGFLRLSKAVEQSENTLNTMAADISRLQEKRRMRIRRDRETAAASVGTGTEIRTAVCKKE